MKFFNADKALCVSPHADDTEFGMAGTILKHEDTKFHILVFSTGSDGDKTSDKERFEEVKNFWAHVSNVELHFLSERLSDLTDERWIIGIEKLFNLKEFQALFLPSLTDTHYEHRAVHNIAMALTRSTPLSIVEYRSPSTHDTWIPNLFVSITDYILLDKMNRLTSFVSQKKLYLKGKYLNALHSWPSAIKKGIDLCEQLRIVSLYE